MDFHDPFLVLNLNIIIALTILVFAVTVFIIYCEQREKEKSRPQARNACDTIMCENRFTREKRKIRGRKARLVMLKNQLRTYVSRLMK